MFSKDETVKVKGIAILLLMFHHLFYNVERVTQSGMRFLWYSEEQIQPIAIAARICVWIFVFLSAYGLTYSYNKNRQTETTLQFMVKHWLSLMKTYWVVYIVIFVAYFAIVGNPMQIYNNSIISLGLDFMGWANFFDTPMILSVWWYMCFAQILVFLIPIFDSYCEKFGMAGYIIGFFVLQYLPEGIQSAYSGLYSNYFLVAILAVICVKNQLLDRMLDNKKSGIKNVAECMGLFLVIVFLLIFKYKFAEFDQWQINSFISGLAAFLIVIIVSKYLQGKILVGWLNFLGKHSGNMFMIHAFFYLYLKEILYWSHNTVISYFTLVLLSVISSIGIEFIKKLLQYDERITMLMNNVLGRL